jgi:hypothetical protein
MRFDGEDFDMRACGAAARTIKGIGISSMDAGASGYDPVTPCRRTSLAPRNLQKAKNHAMQKNVAKGGSGARLRRNDGVFQNSDNRAGATCPQAWGREK